MGRPATEAPAYIAIREGIAARVLELGFQKNTKRIYTKETGDYSEWVHFTLLNDDAFFDVYGVFDNGLQRFYDDHLDHKEDSAIRRNPRPYHLEFGSLPGMVPEFETPSPPPRTGIFGPLLDRISPREPPPPPADIMQFWGMPDRCWLTSPGIEGCANLSRRAWMCGIEPVRETVIADPKSLIRHRMEHAPPAAYLYRLLMHAYIGEKAAARAIADQMIAARGQGPTAAYLKEYRKYKAIRSKPTEQMIEDTIAETHIHADRCEMLIRSLCL